jgi:hypothetical protein
MSQCTTIHINPRDKNDTMERNKKQLFFQKYSSLKDLITKDVDKPMQSALNVIRNQQSKGMI